jgi:hypothetical protein
LASDVDVVILATSPATYLTDLDWLADVGVRPPASIEPYGDVTSLRGLFDGELEVELSIAPHTWAATPVDDGTRDVALGGIRVLLDRDGDATTLAAWVDAEPRRQR